MQSEASTLPAGPMTIGMAAQASGISAKMLRHYESLGLLPPVARTDSGYRLYRPEDVNTLRFIRRARDLGFSMAEIGELVSLWQDRGRASAQVKLIAQRHVDDLNQRIAGMQDMQRSLQRLLRDCHGDSRPECPILDGLAGQSPPLAEQGRASGEEERLKSATSP